MKKYVMATALALVLGTAAFSSAQAITNSDTISAREQRITIAPLVTKDKSVKVKGRVATKFMLFRSRDEAKKYLDQHPGSPAQWPYWGTCWSNVLSGEYPCLYNW